MNQESFKELVESVKEAVDIYKGNTHASRTFNTDSEAIGKDADGREGKSGE
jgi:hypothetical protein